MSVIIDLMDFFRLPNRLSSPKKGFTLVEILIAIAILAVITTVGITTYSASQKIARDSVRKQDLKQIAAALNLYKNKNDTYPLSFGGTPNLWYNDWTNSTDPDWISGLAPNYLPTLPVDPENKFSGGLGQFASSSGDDRIYAYKSDISTDYPSCPAAGQWFALGTILENSHDVESAINTSDKWCDGTTEVKDLPFSGQSLEDILNAKSLGVYMIVVTN